MTKKQNLIFKMVVALLMLCFSVSLLFCDFGEKYGIKEAFSGLLVTVGTSLFTYLVASFNDYRKISKLETSLIVEIGFIARAIFYNLSDESIKISELKETFSVKNAVMHTVGSDIALLDKKTNDYILEFHSMMKVVYNLICDTPSNTKKIEEAIMRLVNLVESNSKVMSIVYKSTHATAGVTKYKLKQEERI